MRCASHPDRDAAAVCTRCDKPVCEECTEERNGRHFCDRCAQFIDQRAEGRPGAGAPVGAPLPAGPVADSRFAGQPEPVPAVPVADSFQANPSADLYQGPAGGELYQGPAGGDVYQGPDPTAAAHGGAATMPGTAGGEQESAGSLGRGFIYGAAAGVIAALVWYGVALVTDWKLGPIAALVGWAVGLATAFGSSRHGGEVATLSVALAIASMMGGEYLLWDHFYQEFAQQESEYVRMLSEIGSDRRFSDDDLRRFYEWGEEAEDWGGASFDQLSASDKREMRMWLREEYDGLVAGASESAELASGGLPFREFLTYFMLDFWNIIFFVIGAGAAFKMGLGSDD